ncbi:hypothetical protein Chor_008734 [Crotalus horridus]
MRLLKALEFLFLSFLVGFLTSDNISDIPREEQGTMLVQKIEPEASSPREDLFPSSLQPITAECAEDEMMIRVHRDLFQTGHFIQAKDLSIGPQACHYSVVNESATLIIFKVELHECFQNLQVFDFVLYNVSLYYKPDSASNLTTVKSAEEFPITCHYPWKNNASSSAMQTTGVPFTSAMYEEGKQYFSLHDWQAEKDSTVYFLGEDLHIQADIRKGNHLPLRLFIDTCMVTSKPDGDSDPQYKILDFHGCLIERNSHDVGPSFISPRLRLETLQFTIPASQIARDERSLIYMACHLKVTAAAQEPDFLNKACSFNRERKIWLPIEGSMEICNCCETKDCGSPGKHTSSDTSNLHVPNQRKQMSSAVVDISEGEMEADLMVGPVLIRKAAGNHERDQVGIEEEILAEDKEANKVLDMESDDESDEIYSGGGDLNIETSPLEVIVVTSQDEVLDMGSDDESDEIYSGSGDLNIETSPVEMTTITAQDEVLDMESDDESDEIYSGGGDLNIETSPLEVTTVISQVLDIESDDESDEIYSGGGDLNIETSPLEVTMVTSQDEVLDMGSDDESDEIYSGGGDLNIETSPVEMTTITPQDKMLDMESDDESDEIYSGGGDLNIETSPLEVTTVISQDEVVDMGFNDKSDQIYSGDGDLNIETSPVEVTTMTPQGNAPVKGTILGQILTTATGILIFFFFSSIA